MKQVVPLAKARDDAIFGSKAVGLGEAARGGLPLPPGVALSGSIVEAVASGEERAIKKVARAVRPLRSPLAVRSSAVDEDGAEASFAGQHLTLLNVQSSDAVSDAVSQVWWSANSDSAITYRQRSNLFVRPSVGVVVQALLDPEVAGVMFTQNPITGADERVIEASWGLGEVVVAGTVIPDHFRVARSGEVLERTPGLKKIAIRTLPGWRDRRGGGGAGARGTTVPRRRPARRAEPSGRPLRGGLRTRARHRMGDRRRRALPAAVPRGHPRRVLTLMPGAPVDVLRRVPLFADLSKREAQQIARLFKERRFAEGETVVREGSGGAAFFLIDSGEATVTVGGKERATLKPGDYFGEIALIDEGARMATITAVSELVCYGLTYWDFRPLVQENGAIGWKLLQSLAKKLRDAQQGE